MSAARYETVARLRALQGGRAVVTRATRDLADDPALTFGIVAMKVVSEEVVQAIAFGPINVPPMVVTRWNPLSRDASDLEVFAQGLDAYVATCIADDAMPRFWLPYPGALSLLEVLGHRYATNRTASPSLQRMGRQCLAIADEATYAGQQSVAIATDVLIRHVATGQAPVKDHHLGALLAWVNPEPGRDPATVAGERSTAPAAGMLTRGADDRIEELRRIGKGRGTAATIARSDIARILADEVEQEWRRLVAAHDAFFGLGLPAATTLDVLIKRSKERMLYHLDQTPSRPRWPGPLSRSLDAHELSEEQVRDAALRGDDVALEQARSAGRAVQATVVRVDQPRRGRFPCTLTIETTQPVLRVRGGTKLNSRTGTLKGRVAEVESDGSKASITFEVTSGVRSVPGPGAHLDLIDSDPYDPSFVMRMAYRRIGSTGVALLAKDPPAPTPRRVAAADLVARAKELVP